MTIARLGIAALLELGASAEVQQLLRVRKRPLQLWGGYDRRSPGGDMSDITYGYGAHIQLGMEGISVECYTTIEAQPKPEYIDTGTSFFFPYAVHDDLLTGRKLAKIATPVPIDWEETPHLSYSELYTNDYLFEVLVECANPKHLNRWFKTSLRG